MKLSAVSKMTLLGLVMVFLSESAQSQSYDDFDQSVGVNVFTYGEKIAVKGSDFDEKRFDERFLNVLIYKKRVNQVKYRLGIGYEYDNDDSYDNLECENCPENSGKLREYQVFAGFEKDIVYGPVRPYFGIDISFFSSNYSGYTRAFGETGDGQKVKSSNNGGAITPFIGLKVIPVSRITLFVEAGFSGMLTYQQYTQKELNNGFLKADPSDSNGWGTIGLLSPIRMLGISYNFGWAE